MTAGGAEAVPLDCASEDFDAVVTHVHPALVPAFRALAAWGGRWALLRGAEELRDPRGDVDLVVEGADSVLDSSLAAAGFHRLVAAGRGSHRFYFRFDAADGTWTKLDVVTSLDFGPLHEVTTGLANDVLDHRRTGGLVPRLDPADEAWLLILHLLLDKGEVPVSRRHEAVSATAAVSAQDPVACHLAATDPGLAGVLLSALQREDWQEVNGLARRVRAALSRDSRTVPVARRMHRRIVRRLSTPWAGGPSGAVVAVLGPDGAGKTTLTRSVQGSLPIVTRYVYMGFWQRRPWDGLVKAVPGGRLAVLLSRAARAGAAIRYHRGRGRVILVDRFRHDLCTSEDTSLGGRIFARAVARLVPDPDLVAVLDAPAEVMFARKGEHTLEVLEEQRQAYLALRHAQPNVVVLDGTREPADLRHELLHAVWTAYGSGFGRETRLGAEAC